MVWGGSEKYQSHQQTGGVIFLLAELIIDLPLEADGPVTDHVANARPVWFGPTQAIVAPYVVDGSNVFPI